MHVFWESQHIPHHSWRTKRHIQNDFCRAKLCRLSCKLITSIPPKILLPWSVFWGLAKPLCRNSEISHRHKLLDISSCLFFQKWLKSVQDKHDKCPKACIVMVTEKKHVFGRVWQNAWGDSPQLLCEFALLSHTNIPGFIHIRFGFWEI